MGKIFKTNTPIVPQVAVCPQTPELLYASYTLPSGYDVPKFQIYGDLYVYINYEISQGGGYTKCPYSIHFFNKTSGIDGKTQCGVGEMKYGVNALQCIQENITDKTSVWTMITETGATVEYHYNSLSSSYHDVQFGSLDYVIYRVGY